MTNTFNGIYSKFTSVTVKSEVRSLRATWTTELADDIDAFHGIDIVEEMEGLLTQELAQIEPQPFVVYTSMEGARAF